LSAFQADPRFQGAVTLFNEGDWYGAHDLFEELWHETNEPERRWLQGMVQLSVALLHRQRGNLHGAMVLLGEARGRLITAASPPLEWQPDPLLVPLQTLFASLQSGQDSPDLPLPRLRFSHASA
jgi:predicted metal-dependent hydrolase